MKQRSTRRRIAILLAAFTIATLVLFAIGFTLPYQASTEAHIYENICHRLIQDTTDSKQALVSSVWWPPLHVLMRIPLTSVIKTHYYPLASLIVSAIFGAASLFLLEKLMRSWNLGWARFLILAAMLAHPAFIRACTDGSSATTVTFFVILTACGFIHWMAARKLRWLIALGFGSAALIWAQFETMAWIIVVLSLLIFEQIRSRIPREQKEATLILVLLPSVYVISLWLLTNWLIMGDALYFIRSLSSESCMQKAALAPQAQILPLHYAATGMLAAVFIFSLIKKDGTGLDLSVLGLGLALIILLCSSLNLLWVDNPLLLCLFAIFLMATACAARILKNSSRIAQIAVLIIPLALTVPLSLQFAQACQDAALTIPATDHPDSEPWIPEIETVVLREDPYAKIFVCGYDSFALLREYKGSVFLRMLDLNFDSIKDDYHGCSLYVMINQPFGRDAMESVHWKYDKLYSEAGYRALHHSDWGNWRLFRIISAPKDKPAE